MAVVEVTTHVVAVHVDSWQSCSDFCYLNLSPSPNNGHFSTLLKIWRSDRCIFAWEGEFCFVKFKTAFDPLCLLKTVHVLNHNRLTAKTKRETMMSV